MSPAESLTGWRASRRFSKLSIAGLALSAAVVVAIIVFDWNWLRGPVQRYISEKTQREFTMAFLDVELGWTPTIKLRDVTFANAPWAKEPQPMARIGSLEFSVSLRGLLDRKLLIPRAAMADASFVFEKTKDDRKNWVLKEPDQAQQPSRVRIGSISVDRGALRYIDHGEPFEIDIQANTFDPQAQHKVTDANAKVDNRRFTTRYAFQGRYHEAPFKGHAQTGEVLSFQQTGIPFPIRGTLDAGSTRVKVDGSIADVAELSGIDVQLEMEGKTLASLYPFLLLPLPASPPYAVRGRLVKEANRYSMDDLAGKIGATDVRGSGAYVDQAPRPLLTADLRSKLLNMADLGPIIGLRTKDTPASPATSGAARPKAAETTTRGQAQQKERQTAGQKVLPAGTVAAKGDGILPSGKFEGGRLRAIDADVVYQAADLKAPTALPVESMDLRFSLHDAVAKLEPIRFGFAGGSIVGHVTIDARDDKRLASELRVDLKGLQMAKVLPESPRIARSAGTLGGKVHLKGTGDSIADAAATANGEMAVAVANGRISNLVDAAASLNGGKLLALLAGGDKEIAVHCGAVVFDVEKGLGKSRVMAIDTAQTVVEGEGTFTLRDERFDVRVVARPKEPGILSLRTPVHAWGSFRNPEFEFEKAPIAARAGAALALAAINPFAAVLALIEPGTDDVAGCQQASAAIGQGRTPQKPAPPSSRSKRSTR
jgi:AsmA family protein